MYKHIEHYLQSLTLWLYDYRPIGKYASPNSTLTSKLCSLDYFITLRISKYHSLKSYSDVINIYNEHAN